MTALPATIAADQSPAWASLVAHHRAAIAPMDLRQAFASDPNRASGLAWQAPYVWADLSKNHVTDATFGHLRELATQCHWHEWRAAMLAGAPINTSEARAAMHWMLRMPADRGLLATHPMVQSWGSDMRQALADVHATLAQMLQLAEAIRADARITDVVAIGIGGSHLGVEMAVQALEDWVDTHQRFHFVSNVDGHELGHVLRRVRPASTVFLIASKSFTTAETMLNAQSARQWFIDHGGSVHGIHGPRLADHFIALTANEAAARAFGIERTLGFWDWVGGRFSLCSAIGLPLAVAIGAAQFRHMLAGAHEMDAHFFTAQDAANLPLNLGLLDVWYRNFCGMGSRCIAPYSHGLRRLSAYLQQLEMESNGKGRNRLGEPLATVTAPIVWGEPGTNGQHAFFQMLHQGPEILPVEFIALRSGGKYLGTHHHSLLINAIAQAQALMLGSSDDNHGTGTAAAHAHCPGNRPSSFLMLEQLDPASLGALIALYEHRIFTSGVVWGINSFDQCGVELGKKLAQGLRQRQTAADWAGVDASTQQLMRRLVAPVAWSARGT